MMFHLFKHNQSSLYIIKPRLKATKSFRSYLLWFEKIKKSNLRRYGWDVCLVGSHDYPPQDSSYLLKY